MMQATAPAKTASGIETNADTGMPDVHGPPATYSELPAYFLEALADAERLLKYAAETGVEIDDNTRDHVLQARVAHISEWSEETAANLLCADEAHRAGQTRYCGEP